MLEEKLPITKNKPLVTVVTVTYNAEEFLVRTIESVINQDYENIEYIIIDGNSSDGTIDIIKRYEEYIDYWISEPDEGIYDAMNKGIDVATGEWINFMNAGDSFVSMEIINLLVTKLNNDVDILFGDIIRIDEDMSNQLYLKGRGLDTIWEAPPCWHQAMLSRININKKYKFDLRYITAADYNFMMDCFGNNYNFKYINIPFAYYLRGGVSDQLSFENKLEALIITSKHIPNIYDLDKHITFKDTLNYYNQKVPSIGAFKLPIDRIQKQLEVIKQQYPKIALYGYGTVGKLVAPYLRENIIIIVDKNIKLKDKYFKICTAEELKQYQFDIVLNTLMEREQVVENYLNKFNIRNIKHFSDYLVKNTT